MAGYYVGVDLGGTYIKAVVMNGSFKSVRKNAAQTQYKETAGVVLFQIIRLIEELLLSANIKKAEVAGIGIGVPGITDNVKNTAVVVPNLRWHDVPVGDIIGKHFGIPVFVENDGSVNALGEMYAGAGKGFKDIILITLGTHLGSGIIVNGRLLGGASNFAGETGHMIIQADGEPCVCGNKGCFGSYCSAEAMIRTANALKPEYPDSALFRYTKGKFEEATAEMISTGFDEGDTLCIKVMEKTVKYLSIGLANLIHLFNPEIIIIGGGVSNAGRRLLDPVREQVKQYLMHPRQNCLIEKAKLGSDAGMLGAAILSSLKTANA